MTANAEDMMDGATSELQLKSAVVGNVTEGEHRS